jgi:exodeoxyribonuclease-3
MPRVASWNVNSVKARLPLLLEWLAEAKPDIVLLQEIKCVDAEFPRLELEAAGWQCAAAGQKTYNGVAILARQPIAVTERALPGDGGDPQARYLEARVGDLRVASIYLPNGNPIGGDKFAYKLAWMARLEAHAAALLAAEEVVVLGGDFNVIPEPIDARTPAAWVNDALFQPASRAAFRRIVWRGWTDAIRALDPTGPAWTYWDYQGGAWESDNGIRIDHLLLSPRAADRLTAAGVDRKPRGKPRASDHTPAWCELA